MKTKILLSFLVIWLFIGIGCKKSGSIPPGEKLSILSHGVSSKSPLIIGNIDKYPDNIVSILDARSGKVACKIVGYNNKDMVFANTSYPYLLQGQYQCVVHIKGKNISLGYFKLRN